MTRAERLQSRQRMSRRRPQGEDRVFREDLGFAMTKSGYEAYTEDEATYQEQYGKVKGQIDTANKALTEAEEKLGGVSIDKEYEKAKKGWVKVNVMHGLDKEGTYFMPKEMVDKMNTDSFNQEEDGSFVGSWGLGEDQGTDPKQYYVDVRPKGINTPYGKELHESMQGAEKELKEEYYKKVSPGLDAQKASATASLRQERDIVQGEYDLLTGSKEQRDLMKSDVKGEYETKRKARGSALAGAIS